MGVEGEGQTYLGPGDKRLGNMTVMCFRSTCLLFSFNLHFFFNILLHHSHIRWLTSYVHLLFVVGNIYLLLCNIFFLLVSTPFSNPLPFNLRKFSFNMYFLLTATPSNIHLFRLIIYFLPMSTFP